jgi:hypothetical protein
MYCNTRSTRHRALAPTNGLLRMVNDRRDSAGFAGCLNKSCRRTAIRKIDMDDDLTMLIGPARDGTPLEIGVLDLNGEDPVVIHAMRLRLKFYPLIRQG